MKYHKKKELLAGLISSVTIVALCWSVESNLCIANTVCLWVLGGIYWFLFLNFVVFRYNLNEKKKLKGIINLSTFILSIVIIILNWGKYDDIILENYYERKMLENNTISIKPLNEVNSNATAAEIWINEIIVNDKIYDIESLDLSNGWRVLDGYIYADDARMAQPLELAFPNNSCYELSFIMTEASGAVELFGGEHSIVIDLYNAERSVLDVDFRNMWEPLQVISINKKIVFTVTCFAMISTIIRVVLFYIARYCDKNRSIKNYENDRKECFGRWNT